MTGFQADIPKHLFEGLEVWSISIGSAHVAFKFQNGNSIMLQPYGVVENRDDWLFNMPLCGQDSVQDLIGQTVDEIRFLAENHAQIHFSGGRILDLLNDDPPIWDICQFVVNGRNHEA